MLDSLKQIKTQVQNDGIYFLPSEEEDGVTRVQIFEYDTPGHDIGSSSMGKMYDIIFFKFDEEESDIISYDHFEAILVEPLEYISNMVKHGLYGLVARKTTTSYNNLISGILESLNEPYGEEDEQIYS